jgi:hypothetical protein
MFRVGIQIRFLAELAILLSPYGFCLAELAFLLSPYDFLAELAGTKQDSQFC